MLFRSVGLKCAGNALGMQGVQGFQGTCVSAAMQREPGAGTPRARVGSAQRWLSWRRGTACTCDPNRRDTGRSAQLSHWDVPAGLIARSVAQSRQHQIEYW